MPSILPLSQTFAKLLGGRRLICDTYFSENLLSLTPLYCKIELPYTNLEGVGGSRWGQSMAYLQQIDQVPSERVDERLSLVNRWIRSEWRGLFAELRERRPIFRVGKIVLVSRYSDVVEVLSRHDDFSVKLYAAKMDSAVGPFMLGRDASPLNWRDKSVMRTMMSIEELPRVREIVARLTDAVLDAQPAGLLDVVGTLARKIPVRLCGAYFGFPGPDESSMLRWSKATQADFFKNISNDPAVHAASVRAGAEMKAYLKSLIEVTRRAIAAAGHPPDLGSQDDTVVARLLATPLPGQIGFDEERLVANVAGLLIGAVETTAQAIVQALDQILRRPELLPIAIAAAGSGTTEALDSIVWEALRFDPINPLLFRFTERDSVIAAGTDRQCTISAGSIVFALTASAMHDRSALPEPDSFNAGRPKHHYLHFGYGHHVCLGEHVGAVMIPEVIRRVLLRPGVGRLPNDGSAIDFAGGPFPERYLIAYGGP